MNKEKELIDKLIDLAFAEDIGDGDHTTLSCIPATAMGKSKLPWQSGCWVRPSTSDWVCRPS